MRGLIYKDIRLLMSQKSFFGILFAVAAFISIIGDNASFSISYGTFMGMTAAISTLNFDEYDNGMAFLMTLPTGKRSYVSSIEMLEKKYNCQLKTLISEYDKYLCKVVLYKDFVQIVPKGQPYCIDYNGLRNDNFVDTEGDVKVE